MIARITKTFYKDEAGKELWYEARADEQLIFKFRAPADANLKIGDAIAFDRCFLDKEALVPVYKAAPQIKITVRSENTKDLRDQRIIAELEHDRSQTRVILRATGQVEISGTHPGSSGAGPMAGMAGFDDVEGFAEYMEDRNGWVGPQWDSAGSDELRRAVMDWLRTTAIPALRAAAAKLPTA